MKYAIEENDGIFMLEVQVVSPLGLHARPAARLVKEAQKFEAKISVALNSAEADVKSILDMMSLGAAQHSTLLFRAEGADAKSSLQCIAGIFAKNFED